MKFVIVLMLTSRTILYCAALKPDDLQAEKVVSHNTPVEQNIYPSEDGMKSSNNSTEYKENSEKYVEYSDFVIDLSKTISLKLADILRKKVESLLSTKHSLNDHNNYKILESSGKNIISGGSKIIGTNLDKNSDELTSNSSDATITLETDLSKKTVKARQFVFHPYLPYGKDITRDEKISIHDVLPIKMVKFIKSMVEDAPWEAMFMKMVRMIVDEFVDKIIEKMFAHKEGEDDKWRSINVNRWSLLKNSLTSVVRLRRSVDKRKSEKEDNWDSSSFSQTNRLSKDDQHKTKELSDNESWLDSVLDYFFPEDVKDDKDYLPNERRKRNIHQSQPIEQLRMKNILHTFLVKFIELSSGDISPEDIHGIVKPSIQHEPLENVSESDNRLKEDPSQTDAETFIHASSDAQSNDMSADSSDRWSKLLKRNPQPETGNPSEVPKRSKRSTSIDKGKEAKRLWQESQRSRPSDLKTRDECSLRKACNAGRLLSRLPSVQDLTLQLKEYGNEPHWDALLWGMTKKRCSKIFCKRQRSPKGSKHSWNNPEKRFHRKHTTPTTRGPRYRSYDSDLTTIFPV